MYYIKYFKFKYKHFISKNYFKYILILKKNVIYQKVFQISTCYLFKKIFLKWNIPKFWVDASAIFNYYYRIKKSLSSKRLMELMKFLHVVGTCANFVFCINLAYARSKTWLKKQWKIYSPYCRDGARRRPQRRRRHSQLLHLPQNPQYR